jgi:hypothetical protein
MENYSSIRNSILAGLIICWCHLALAQQKSHLPLSATVGVFSDPRNSISTSGLNLSFGVQFDSIKNIALGTNLKMKYFYENYTHLSDIKSLKTILSMTLSRDILTWSKSALGVRITPGGLYFSPYINGEFRTSEPRGYKHYSRYLKFGYYVNVEMYQKIHIGRQTLELNIAYDVFKTINLNLRYYI